MMSALGPSTLLFSVLTISGSAQPTKQSLDQLHQRYAKFLVTKNFIAIEAFYNDHISRDFKWKKANGPIMTFIDLWEGNRQDMANLANRTSDGPINFRMKLTSWSLKGNVAAVEVETSGNGEWYKDGSWTPLTFKMLVRETWRYESNKWVAIAFQDISMDAKFGRPKKRSSWRPNRAKA